MTQSHDLLPCPFCGANPEIVIKKASDFKPPESEWSFSFGAAEGESIACVNKMCPMKPYTHPCAPGNIRMFYLNWNSRASVTADEKSNVSRERINNTLTARHTDDKDI